MIYIYIYISVCSPANHFICFVFPTSILNANQILVLATRTRCLWQYAYLFYVYPPWPVVVCVRMGCFSGWCTALGRRGSRKGKIWCGIPHIYPHKHSGNIRKLCVWYASSDNYYMRFSKFGHVRYILCKGNVWTVVRVVLVLGLGNNI